jgi:hypothetical protein
MKVMLVILMFLCCTCSFGQSAVYKESGDTIFINEKMIKPGDTLRLGNGSSPTKDFLFVWAVPTMKNMSINNGSYEPAYLSKMFSNSFLVYVGKQDEGNKKMPLRTPVFLLGGDKKFKYNIDLISAIKMQEIIL